MDAIYFMTEDQAMVNEAKARVRSQARAVQNRILTYGMALLAHCGVWYLPNSTRVLHDCCE